MMKEAVLGISAFYHDSAACLVVDGLPVAAAQEERFTRKKHDASFPSNALRFCLNEVRDSQVKISAVAFYEKPFIKFERLLETYHAFAPRGIRSYLSAIPLWIKEKIFIKDTLKKELANVGLRDVAIMFPEHHLSHAASAFYPSPFEEAAILTLDGVGEWATITIGKGKGNSIDVIKQLDFPHSLGLLYSAFTQYCGFRVNSGEYKLMGLAPYGNTNDTQTHEFVRLIKQEMIDIRVDGSFLLNMKYFEFATGFEMTHRHRWKDLFGLNGRAEDEPISQGYMNLALAAQRVAEEVTLNLATTAKVITQCDKLVLSGGVALNCVSNSRIVEKKIFDNLWVQPAAGDAGGALGSALAVWHIAHSKPRITQSSDRMSGAYLGNQFSESEVIMHLNQWEAIHELFENFDQLSSKVAHLLHEGNVIGWFQGRMEYGPRALGNRSILADPCQPAMHQKLNLKIKQREGFRPFAPAVREEDMLEYFANPFASPYMLFTMPFLNKHCYSLPDDWTSYDMSEKCYTKRSEFQAVTHVDFSARVQSVSNETNPRFWKLLTQFKKVSGHGILVNTSFNVRGEPIVCSPGDAYRCFMETDMDYLVLGNILLDKGKQPELSGKLAKRTFEPD